MSSQDELEVGHATPAEAEAEAEVAVALDETEADAPLVGILVPSSADLDVMDGAAAVLRSHDVRHELRVLPAHRDPQALVDYCRNAQLRGLRVLIAGAGLSAGLPGIAAAHSRLPVIGVPLTHHRSAAGGLDAILSVVQAPTGAPVATVGLDSAENAGHLAVRILGL